MNLSYREAVVSDYLRCREAEPDLSIPAYYDRLLKANPVVPFACRTMYNWLNKYHATQQGGAVAGAVTWVNNDVALVDPAEQQEQLEEHIPFASKSAPAPAGIAAVLPAGLEIAVGRMHFTVHGEADAALFCRTARALQLIEV